MSLGETRLKFTNKVEAERWFDQLREQWVVRRTKIEPNPHDGGVIATAICATSGGALVPAQREGDENDVN